MTNQRPVSCGLDFCSVPDISQCLFAANSSKFEFICAPLVHPLFKREFVYGVAKTRTGPFTRPDLVLCSSDWNNLIIGKLSPYIKVDSKNRVLRKNSEETLIQELTLASHLGLVGVTFKLTGGIEHNTNLARIICDKLSSTCSLQVWIQVPMENPIKQAYFYREEECDSVESPWEWWNAFRAICDYDRKLGVTLIVSHDLPEQEEIDRWLGEPVKCLIFPTTSFITNKKGFPVLSKAHQALVKKFAALEVQFVLTGANRHLSLGYYHDYLEYLWKGCQMSGPVEMFTRGYEDYLQCPLQPLSDNLESQTYEIFEKDPVKYTQYQTAIHQAILKTVSTSEDNTRKIVIMVVGAGRGPLVHASLNAAEMANQKIKVYAVEKNPNAVLTLQALERDVWEDKVTVVSCDMRDWDAPEKADILVSELLGSFGDNELSPECLDGVQRFLKDRLYTDRHEWITIDGKIGTVGISKYAQEALGDVVYAQLPDVASNIEKGAECGALESVKAASELYSPVSGKIIEKNETVEKTPSLVNTSCYEEGWLFKIELSHPDEVKTLMDEKSYNLYLESDPH
nr:PREDICTED: protein arginine N-methyltransferase 5 isoform X4 [Megachile rotundata]